MVARTMDDLLKDFDRRITTQERRLTRGGSASSGGLQIGAIYPWAASTLPTGHLELNGQTVVGGATTYPALAALFPEWVSGANLVLPNWGEQVPVGLKTRLSLGTATVTIATPGVVTRNAHGLANGQRVEFTTTGALPTGIVAGTRYFVRDSTLNTFRLASTLTGAAINTTGSQSGTHTLWDSDFTVLDESVGAKTHTLVGAETPNLDINIRRFDGDANDYLGGSNNPYGIATPYTSGGVDYNIAKTGGGDRPHANVQPSRVVRWIICAVSSVGEGDPTVQAALVASVSGLVARESLARVIPTSMSVASGSGAFSATTGLCTFTTATAVSLNGIFSDAYRNYVVIWNVTSASGGAGMMLRLGVGTTDDTTGYYLTYSEHAGSGAWTFGTSALTLRVGRMAGAGAAATARIYTPFLSDRRSWVAGDGIDSDGYKGLGSGYHGTNKSHDRLTIFPEGVVTMTGTVQVFGVL